MKILFVHDHVFSTKDGLVYSDKLPYDVLKRYISVFSSITVLARNIEVKSTGSLPLSSGEGVDFVFLESVASLKSFFGERQKKETIVEKLLLEHDGLIARLPSEYGSMATKLAEKMNIKYAVEVVGCVWDGLWNYGKLSAKLYAPYMYIKTRLDVKKSKHTLYVTEKFLQKRYPALASASVVSVSNVELINYSMETFQIRNKKINDINKKIIFGTIGSLKTRYKGIHVAIQALSRIKLENFDFEYHILGAGKADDYILLAEELGIGDKVFFDGTLSSGNKVLEWLDNIDIYLQPSFQEGLPRALIEAMSRACPSIGSTAGGIPELLNASMIFTPQRPEDLSWIMESLIQDKSLMKKEAKRNFETSAKYQKKILDKKRNDFWINFRDEISKSTSNEI